MTAISSVATAALLDKAGEELDDRVAADNGRTSDTAVGCKEDAGGEPVSAVCLGGLAVGVKDDVILSKRGVCGAAGVRVGACHGHDRQVAAGTRLPFDKLGCEYLSGSAAGIGEDQQHLVVVPGGNAPSVAWPPSSRVESSGGAGAVTVAGQSVVLGASGQASSALTRTSIRPC